MKPHPLGWDSFVYFVQNGEADAFRGLVKVGSSSRPAHRLAELQRMSPVRLRVLAIVPGSMSDEFAIHRELPWRRHGEWFGLSARLVARLIDLVDERGLAFPELVDPRGPAFLGAAYVMERVRTEEEILRAELDARFGEVST